MQLSVRLKLTLWSVLVLAVALLAFGGMLRYQVQRDTMRSIDADLEQFCRMARDHANGRGPDGPPGERHGPPGPPGPPPGDGFGWSGLNGPENGRPNDGERPNRVGFGGPPQRFGGPGGGHFNSRNGGERQRGFNGFNDGGAGRDEAGGVPRPHERIFDLNGAPISGFATEAAWDADAVKQALKTRKPVFSNVVADGEPLRVLTIPLDARPDGGPQGALQGARALGDLNWVIDRLTRTLFLFIPVCLLLAGIGGAFTASRALSPVRRITEAASRMGAQDLNARLPEAGGDEFAQLAHTFNALFARLQSAFEQQRRFTADASHELRTPLTAIKAHTSLALQGERTNAQYRDALVAADRSVNTATRIVTDLLLLTRSDNDRLGLRLTPTHLIGALLEAVEAIETVETNPPPIEVAAPDSSLRVLGDAHHLTRLFTNLLENAARHTPSTGRIRITVDKAVTSGGDAVVVVIEDNGEGIGREHLPHVRERFYRADASRTRASGGTGLGLAICQSIVDAHRGAMEIESERGEGTCVRIILPLAPSGQTAFSE